MKKSLSLCLFFLACSTAPSAPSAPSSNPIGVGRIPNFSELAPGSDYVIYSDEATLPTLYMSINMLTHNKESYFWMGRAGTLDLNKLPSRVESLASDDDLRTKIAELNAANPSSTFTFYMNDLRLAKLQSLFYSQGIPESRVRAVQLSDGSGTYNDFAIVFGNASGAFSKWLNLKNSIETGLKLLSPLDKEFFWVGNNKGAFAVGSDTYPNIEIWMQWTELLASDDPSLREYLSANTNKYYKVDPYSYFTNLPADKQNSFLSLVGLDKKWAPNEGNGTLNNQTIGEALDSSPNSNIIITGTNPYGSGMDDLIALAKKKYGTGYDYFFKGHPGASSVKPADTSITVLPFRLPMEAIIWVFGDKIHMLGGIESSLYMNAPKTTKKFFFNEKSDGSSLVAPLNIMFRQGLLGNVEFINN